MCQMKLHNKHYHSGSWTLCAGPYSNYESAGQRPPLLKTHRGQGSTLNNPRFDHRFLSFFRSVAINHFKLKGMNLTKTCPCPKTFYPKYKKGEINKVLCIKKRDFKGH